MQLRHSGTKKRNVKNKSSFFSYVILAISFLVPFTMTLIASSVISSNNEKKAQEQFDQKVARQKLALERQFENYEDAMRSTTGLFSASVHVSQDEFESYVESLNVDKSVPGANGIGYIENVDPTQIDTFVESAINDGADGFSIKQLGDDQNDYFVIKYIEPQEPNMQAFGLNVASEPSRKAAAILARDSGEIAVTEEINLVQDKTNSSGFLIFYPIYKSGAKTGTIEQRRNAIVGWIYTPVVANSFFEKLSTHSQSELGTEVFDGAKTSSNAKLYEDLSGVSKNPRFTSTKTVNFYQHQWTFKYSSTKSFDSGFDNYYKNTVLIFGLLSSFVSLFLVYLIIKRTSMTKSEIESKTQELAESENRFALAVKGAKDGIWDWPDITKDEVYWSPQFYALLGYKDGEIEPTVKAFNETFLHPEDHEDSTAAFRKAIEENTRWKTKYRLKVKSGEYRWFSTTGIATHDPDTGVTRVTGSMSDINDLIEVQERLELNEERLDLAIKGSQVGLFDLFDVKKQEGYLSPQWYEMLGYEPNEFPATAFHFSSLLHVDDYAITLEKVVEAIKETRSFDIEYRLKTKSGDYCWVQAKGIVTRNPKTKVKRITGSIADISERKKVERLKNEFVSIVSHELRTPLTSIRGSLGLINGKMSEDIPEKVNTLISIAYRNAEQLVTIVSDILDIDKIASGQLKFEIGAHSISEFVNRALETTMPYAESFNISLETGNIDEDIVAYFDPERTNQIIANLLSNAIKFSPAKSKVIVSASQKGGFVRVSVEDFGYGIPDKFRKDIFTKFSQADGSSSRKRGGSGLGLYISKNFTEKMGGRIGFDSKEAGGTIFWFELPVQERTDHQVSRMHLEGKIHESQS